MQGIYYAQFKLNVDDMVDAETVVDNMDYSIEAPAISETEIVSHEVVGENQILVTAKIYLELDMDYTEAQETLNEADYYFDYDDDIQSIVDTEMVAVNEDMD
jgi:hypothetical protein